MPIMLGFFYGEEDLSGRPNGIWEAHVYKWNIKAAKKLLTVF